MKNDAPIAHSRAGAPILFGALGASFHLESLVPEDGVRLGKVCERLHEWLGPKLRWTWSSAQASVDPFDFEHLQLVSEYPGQLVDTEDHVEARALRGASAMAAAHYDRFGVACHGAAQRNDASPFSLRFHATLGPPVGAARGSGERRVFAAQSMLAFTVPLDTELDEFAAKVTEIASQLRLRWGAAGLAYGAWEHDRYGETRDAIYAHARRYPGYDLGQHATLMRAWHERARTVSWLTFLGPAFVERLRGAGARLESDALVTVGEAGDGLVLKAGPRPEAGDANRREIPRAYARADRMLRPIRAASGVHFLAPWSERTSEAWLGRLEESAGR